MNQQQDLSTPERILKVAEAKFAEEGYRGVSLRSVIREAGVNTAAIHYHFGSKQFLLEEIFERRCGPMNEVRLKLLAECREGPDRPPLLEQILEAYLRPSLIWPHDPDGAQRFLRLRAVVASEHQKLAQELISRHFNEVSRTFIAALRDAIPDLPEKELLWRFHFLLGAQYYTQTNPRRIAILSEGRCDASDAEESLAQMVYFFARAFRLPASTGDSMVFRSSREAVRLMGGA